MSEKKQEQKPEEQPVQPAQPSQPVIKLPDMPTSKEALKGLLDKAATVLETEWHTQGAHKAAVAVWLLDCLEIKGEKRKAVLELFDKTPSSFGCNSSAFGQSLGRKSKKEHDESKFQDL